MHWVIIAGLIVLAAYIVMKIMHFSHLNSKLWITVAILLLGFLGLSFFLVVNTNSISLNTTNGFFFAVKLYLSWLGHAFGNIRAITGDAVKMNWFPNATG